MVSQEQIKPFILHPVRMVRDYAANYFHNHNQQPADLMEWVLKAVVTYNASKCGGLLSAAREFRRVSISPSEYDELVHIKYSSTGQTHLGGHRRDG